MNFSEFHKTLQDKPTYVILGVQGSGTNLTAQILRKVFEISVVRDRSLILGTAASLVGNCSPDNLKRARDKIYQCLFPSPIRKRLLPRQWFHQAANYQGIQDVLHQTAMSSPEEFASFFYAYHAYVDDCQEKGIKSDDCWQQLDKIDQVIPHRKNILLVRDPRDNANSIMYKDFGPRTVYAASRYVNHQLDLYLRETESHPDTSLTTKYETLLATPHEFVRDFAELSGLAIPANVDERIEQLGIRTKNFDKWKRWSPYDIAVSEAIFGDNLTKLGYDPHSTDSIQLSTTAMARLRAIDIAKRIPQRLKSIWEHKVLAK